MDALFTGSSRRQSKRVRQQSLPKSSYTNPLNLEDDDYFNDNEQAEEPEVNKEPQVNEVQGGGDPSFSDDDDFVNPPRKTYTTVNLSVATDVVNENKSTPNPHRNERGVRIKHRAQKQRHIQKMKQQRLENIENKDTRNKRKQAEKDVGHQGVQKKAPKKSKKVKIQLVDEDTDDDDYDDEAPEIMEKKGRRKKAKRREKDTDEDEAPEIMQKKIKRKKAKSRERDNITDVFKIRNSPSNLREMLSRLSEQQKAWVHTTGFGRLLDFAMGTIPHRLAYHVFQSFDAATRSLKLPCGTIPITAQDVSDVLGFPVGEQTFEYASTSARKDLWTSQFPNTLHYNISPSTVIDIMNGMDEASELFKINFLVIISNFLIERNTSSYLIRDVLDYEIELDNCGAYNWGEFLITSLVKTKNSWATTLSVFYPGPIVFLTVFYVDRVIIKGKEPVERQFPAFRAWTNERLKQRQLEEIKEGSFGHGDIVPARWQLQNPQENERNDGHHNVSPPTKEPSAPREEEKDKDPKSSKAGQEAQTARSEEMDGNTGFAYTENDAPPESTKPRSEEDWFEQLSVKAALLMDAVNIYKSEFEYAKRLHPNDINIFVIEGQVNTVIQELMQSSQKTNDEPENEGKQTPQPNSESASQNTNDEPENEAKQSPDPNCFVHQYKNDKIDADILDFVELIEYVNSSQGCRDYDNFSDELLIPSFSLGLDINKEHMNDNTKPDAENVITPAPEKKDKRTKREAKLGAAYRSPYVRREIDINEKYSTQDYAVWRWIIQTGRDNLEQVFVCGDTYCIREHMATLKPGKNLYYSVVDVWSSLMNEKEAYKAAESPSRLFFNTAVSTGPLNDTKSEDEQYNIFLTEMDHFTGQYPNTKIETYDLIFFPLLCYNHYYLICLNVKNQSWDIIDNINRGKVACKQLGSKVSLLKKHFIKYLKDEEGMTYFATSINTMKNRYMTMTWQTLNNYTDCGVFLMRHMETYKGDKKNWNTQFKSESTGQKAQIDRLRTKYTNAILTSHMNEKRAFVLEESKLLYNNIAKEGLLKVVIEASARKQKTRKFEGPVLFPDLGPSTRS